MAKSKKILILRFGALGDIVHTTIIAQAIKAQYPEHQIHYCCEARYVHVLQNNPDIDKIIPFDHKRKKDWKYNLQFALDFRKEEYDIIFNLTNALRNNFMTFVAKPKLEVKKFPMGHKHVVDAFFLSAEKAFPELPKPRRLRLGTDPAAVEKVKKLLEGYKGKIVVFSPGGQTDNNRQGRAWPQKNWVELGNLLKRLYDVNIFITGAPSEKEAHQKIAERIEGAVLLTGKFSIAESMALFSLCNLFISGDSGPLHIASGYKVNALGLFGSTNPENVKPYGEYGYAVCANSKCKFCWKKQCAKLKEGKKYTPCMLSITPEHVINSINRNKLLGSDSVLRIYES